MDQSNEKDANQQPAEGERLNRRLFFFRSLAGVATAAMGAAAVTAATTEPAHAQSCTDRDPGDAVGYGRWCRRRVRSCSDADPGDPSGWRCRRVYRRRLCTDADPYDARGRGIRC